MFFENELLWPQFVKLNNIKNLSINEQVQSYNKYLESLSLQRKLYDMGAAAGKYTTAAPAPIPPAPSLILSFDSAFPSGVTDPTSVANWNTFFGSTFTSVTISGLEARLRGGSTFNMAASKLVSTGLNYIDDEINCVLRISTYTLAANPNLTTVKLPALTSIINNYVFMGSCTDVDNIIIYIPACASIGGTVGDDSVFSSAFGSKTITLTVPASRMTCNTGNPDGDIQYLQANNTVTVITV